jgi:hypothetical protein
MPLTMAYLVHTLGMYDVGEGGTYYWLGTDQAAVWLKPDGEVRVDLYEVATVRETRETYYSIIGWCASHRIPCALLGDTIRKAWRP